MKRVFPILILTILCVHSYAQDGNLRRIEFPETDSLVYLNQKLKEQDLIIYGDRVNGIQYGGDMGRDGTDYFKMNVIDKNKGIQIGRDEKGVFVNVFAVSDSCIVTLYEAKLAASGTSYDKGEEFKVKLVKVANPLKDNAPVGTEVPQNGGINDATFQMRTKIQEDKDSNLGVIMPLILLIMGLLTMLFLVYIYIRLAKLSEEFKRIQSNSSKENILKIFEERDAKVILQKEISDEIDKRAATINANSSKVDISVEDISTALITSAQFIHTLKGLVSSISPQIVSIPVEPLESEPKFIRNDVTFDPSLNCFYPDSLSQHLFDIYNKNGQLYYSLTKDEVIRRTLVSGISYYDGCLKIEENIGFQVIVPVEDGMLNLIGDKYYVDTNNKLRVKIV